MASVMDTSMYRLEIDDAYLEFRIGSGNTIEIWDISAGSERRQGRGRKLLTMLILWMRKQASSINRIWAITRASNFVAQQWYEAMKFRVIAPLRDFYATKDSNGKDTVDAIMYGLDINPTE